MPKVKIENPDNEIPREVLAKEICKLSDAINKLLLSGLNVKAIVVLLRDSTGLSKRNIQAVINAIAQLRADYTHD